MKQIKKNGTFSIRVILVSIITFGVMVQGCSDENDFSPTSDIKEIQEANLIAAQYLELANNQYVLNLSEKNAGALGISKSDYNRMMVEIHQTNSFIIECQTNRINIELNDPKNIQIEPSYIRLKSDTEGDAKKPDIKFNMDPTGATASGSGHVPSGVKSVTIKINVGCLIGSGYGYVKIGGQTITYAASGFCGGSTTVPIPNNNTKIEITGNTICSFGGTVSVTFNY